MAGPEHFTLPTTQGTITGLLTRVPGADRAAVLVGGAGGGMHGPAGVYADLAVCLRNEGVTTLRLEYRRPNDLPACVSDVRQAVGALAREGVTRVVLVGWSFGGAVVIRAGAELGEVVGVATVASQTYGTEAVRWLAPKALLLLHGTADTTLSDRCSRSLYAQAGEPKELVLFPGDNHGLTLHRAEMLDKLCAWIPAALAGRVTPGASAASASW